MQHGLNQSSLSLLLKNARLQSVKTAPLDPAFFEVELPKPSITFDCRIHIVGRLAPEVRNESSPAERSFLLKNTTYPELPLKTKIPPDMTYGVTC